MIRRALHLSVAIAVGMVAATGGAGFAAAANVVKVRQALCEHQRGHTIYEHRAVRVLTRATRSYGESYQVAYGCLRGRSRLVELWAAWPPQETTDTLSDVAGDFAAVDGTLSNQYGYYRALIVYDLADGRSYPIADFCTSDSGQVGGYPATPGPWPLERVALGPDGRTARLYDTYAPAASPSAETEAQPTGQVLDIVGFDGFDRLVTTAGPGVIAARSLSYNGTTVTWKQSGQRQSRTRAAFGPSWNSGTPSAGDTCGTGT